MSPAAFAERAAPSAASSLPAVPRSESRVHIRSSWARPATSFVTHTTAAHMKLFIRIAAGAYLTRLARGVSSGSTNQPQLLPQRVVSRQQQPRVSTMLSSSSVRPRHNRSDGSDETRLGARSEESDDTQLETQGSRGLAYQGSSSRHLATPDDFAKCRRDSRWHRRAAALFYHPVSRRRSRRPPQRAPLGGYRAQCCGDGCAHDLACASPHNSVAAFRRFQRGKTLVGRHIQSPRAMEPPPQSRARHLVTSCSEKTGRVQAVHRRSSRFPGPQV